MSTTRHDHPSVILGEALDLAQEMLASLTAELEAERTARRAAELAVTRVLAERDRARAERDAARGGERRALRQTKEGSDR